MTAAKLVTWISLYQLSNVTEPWIAGKHLICHDMPVSARTAGLELLKACIQSRSELPAVARLMFYNDIHKAFAKEDFDYQISALTLLTKDARDISGIAHCICEGLAKWIDQALASLESRRLPTRRGNMLSLSARHEDLRHIISFITNLMKFNFPNLDEGDISFLTLRVVSICKRTGDQEDIHNALLLFDAVARYGYITKESLSEVINVICSVYHGLPALQISALSVMQNILKSHMSHAALQALKVIVQCQSNVHHDVILGALDILTTRWTQCTEDFSAYSFNLESLFQSYLIGLRIPSSRADRNQAELDVGYLVSVVSILEVSHIANDLQYDEWLAPIDITIICARGLELPKESTWTELSDVFQRLLAMLEVLYISRQVLLPVPAIILLWSRLSRLLPVSTAALLCDHYRDEFKCYPSDPFWLKNVRRLFQDVYANEAQDINLRISVLEHIMSVLLLVSSTEPQSLLAATILDLLQLFGPGSHHDVFEPVVKLVVQIVQVSDMEQSRRGIQLLEEYSSGGARPPTSPEDDFPTRVGDHADLDDSVLSSYAHAGKQSRRPIKLSKIDDSKVELIASETTTSSASLGQIAVKGLLTTFEFHFALPRSERTVYLFDKITTLLTLPGVDTSSRLLVLGLLSRLKVNAEGYLALGRAIQIFDMPGKLHSVESRFPIQSEIRSEYHLYKSEMATDSLRVDMYLNALTQIIFEEIDCNLYLHAIEIAKSQLSDRRLFESSVESVLNLRDSIVDSLTGHGLREMNLPLDVKVEDFIVSLVELLALLLGYHDLFSKGQEDEIVAGLQNVLARYQRATLSCIRTLTICAYEIPLSTSKNMSSILIRLSQLVTSTNASLHILEFLSSLANLGDQYVNFREEDYRRVFGIALQHIQYSNATVRDAVYAGVEDPLLQPISAYVLMLAFNTVYAWFLALKLPQRPKYLKWIVDGLLAANPNSKMLDERGQVCFDFLTRFSYSNADIINSVAMFSNFEAEQSSHKSWILGNSIMTIRTMNISGLTELVIRRPVRIEYQNPLISD